jgi:hypothetical protein
LIYSIPVGANRFALRSRQMPGISFSNEITTACALVGEFVKEIGYFPAKHRRSSSLLLAGLLWYRIRFGSGFGQSLGNCVVLFDGY